jgi:hypothetical protein
LSAKAQLWRQRWPLPSSSPSRWLPSRTMLHGPEPWLRSAQVTLVGRPRWLRLVDGLVVRFCGPCRIGHITGDDWLRFVADRGAWLRSARCVDHRVAVVGLVMVDGSRGSARRTLRELPPPGRLLASFRQGPGSLASFGAVGFDSRVAVFGFVRSHACTTRNVLPLIADEGPPAWNRFPQCGRLRLSGDQSLLAKDRKFEIPKEGQQENRVGAARSSVQFPEPTNGATLAVRSDPVSRPSPTLGQMSIASVLFPLGVNAAVFASWNAIRVYG